MLCPKCNHEVMNVNGRYVCIECGSEFDESQLGGANSSQDPSMTEEGPATTETTETVESAPETPATDVEVSSTEPTEETVPPVEVASDPIPDTVIPTENSIEQVLPDQPEPLETPSIDGAQTEEIPSTQEDLNNLDLSNLQTIEPQELPAEQTQSTESSIAETSEAIEPATIPVEAFDTPTNPEQDVEVAPGLTDDANVEETPAENSTFDNMPDLNETEPQPVENISAPIEPTVDQMVAPQPELMPVDEKPANSVDSVELPQMPEPVADVQQPTPEQAPVDMFETAETPTPPAYNQNIDQNVYQNPMFDQSLPQEAPKTENEKVQEAVKSSSKTLLTILIAGAVVFVLFIAGGIYAYVQLTQPTPVPKTQIPNLNQITAPNTNNSAQPVNDNTTDPTATPSDGGSQNQ